MKIALASLDQKWERKDENLARCAEQAARAAASGADLVAFPEMTLTGFTMNAHAVAEPPDDSHTIAAFKDLAREHNMHVAFGVALHGERLPQNTLVVVGRTGAELGRYAKIHPFSHADEHHHYEPGSASVIVTVAQVELGLTICYDLRFPELYTMLAPSCAAILVIANWPAARIDHWNVLLRARAIDCQCFVVGVNRTGSDAAGIEYPPSSQVWDPRGVRVQPRHTAGILDIFDLDPVLVSRFRRTFPTLRDRRPDLYRTFSS
jgi:omega-amidase